MHDINIFVFLGGPGVAAGVYDHQPPPPSQPLGERGGAELIGNIILQDMAYIHNSLVQALDANTPLHTPAQRPFLDRKTC